MKTIVALISSLLLCSLAFAMEEEVIVKYHKRKIGPRWGAEFNRDWDRLVRFAQSENDGKRKNALRIIFDAEIPLGQDAAWYQRDLYRIFEKRPYEFISQGLKHFKNKKQCLNYWLIRENQAIPMKEYVFILNKAINLHEGSKRDMLKSFLFSGKKWHKMVSETGGDSSVHACDFYAFRSKPGYYDPRRQYSQSN